MAPNVETTRSKLSSGERHVLSVALDPLDVDAGVGRATPGVLEELGRDVQADDVRPAARSRDSDVASRARADVQQVETGTDVDAIEDDRADGLDEPRAASQSPAAQVARARCRSSSAIPIRRC